MLTEFIAAMLAISFLNAVISGFSPTWFEWAIWMIALWVVVVSTLKGGLS